MSTVMQGGARNYGDPAAEYVAARSGAGVHVRTDRALLRVYGRDPQRIVQGIVTNDIVNMPQDRAAYAALLTPKGRMVADVRVMRRGADLMLDVPAAALESLLALFKRTIPPLFAKFEDVTLAHAMLGVYGPRAASCVDAVLGSLPQLPPQDGFHVAHLQDIGDAIVLTALDTADAGYELIVPADVAPLLCDRFVAAGAARIGDATLDVMRIEGGTPRWGAELDDTTIPLEADLLARAISTNKGCYTGQEVIIRVLHRGHVNWHLRGVLLGDTATPARGTQLFAAGAARASGRITSATWSPRHDQVIALAYVRREIAPPATLQLGDATGPDVTVMPLPFVTAR